VENHGPVSCVQGCLEIKRGACRLFQFHDEKRSVGCDESGLGESATYELA
jgi:hypothetical protein